MTQHVLPDLLLKVVNDRAIQTNADEKFIYGFGGRLYEVWEVYGDPRAQGVIGRGSFI